MGNGLRLPVPIPVDILGLTCEAFAAEATSRGLRAPDAIDLYRAVFRNAVAPPGWITLPDMPVTRIQEESPTRKYTQRVDGRLETESVLLPQRSRVGNDRVALCVSSQVGCAMGCAFCETAQMGLLRNLSAAEIVAQWYAARHALGAAVDNVVFMGMGEPMDNVDAVVQSIRVFAGHNGPAIPPSRISVSTVGRIDGINRLADLVREPGFRQVRLAVSLNAPNDEVRSGIMPLNRAMPMAALMTAMRAWPAPARLPILIEYVLIPGVNDAPEHADELCAYLAPLACTLNVIPYNPRRDSPWPAPAEHEVDRFIAQVRARGQFVKRRRTLGCSVMGACGQLGNGEIRRRRMPRTIIGPRVDSRPAPPVR